MMMFGFGSHWAIWQVALMWVWMTAFGGLLLWAVYALVKSGTAHRPGDGRRGDEPRHILSQRLARGEIDTGDFHRLSSLIVDGDRTSVATADRQ
jgi:uncharacterized membrane protein